MAVNYHEGETDPSRFRVWWNSSSLRDIFVSPYRQCPMGSWWQQQRFPWSPRVSLDIQYPSILSGIVSAVFCQTGCPSWSKTDCIKAIKHSKQNLEGNLTVAILLVPGSRNSTQIWRCLINCLRSVSRWLSAHCRCLVTLSRPSPWPSPRRWLQLELSNRNIHSSVRPSRRSSTLHFISRVCTVRLRSHFRISNKIVSSCTFSSCHKCWELNICSASIVVCKS